MSPSRGKAAPPDVETALSRMAALCSSAEHCEQDIRQKLLRAGLDSPGIQAVIDRLYEGGWLDTARYCRAFAHDQLRFARWGRLKISAALRAKGLPAGDIAAAIGELSDAECEAALDAVVAAKLRQLGDDDPHRREKLLRHAVGRGFTPEEVFRRLE